MELLPFVKKKNRLLVLNIRSASVVAGLVSSLQPERLQTYFVSFVSCHEQIRCWNLAVAGSTRPTEVNHFEVTQHLPRKEVPESTFWEVCNLGQNRIELTELLGAQIFLNLYS
jgi:hypothetical protein